MFLQMAQTPRVAIKLAKFMVKIQARSEGIGGIFYEETLAMAFCIICAMLVPRLSSAEPEETPWLTEAIISLCYKFHQGDDELEYYEYAVPENIKEALVELYVAEYTEQSIRKMHHTHNEDEEDTQTDIRSLLKKMFDTGHGSCWKYCVVTVLLRLNSISASTQFSIEWSVLSQLKWELLPFFYQAENQLTFATVKKISELSEGDAENSFRLPTLAELEKDEIVYIEGPDKEDGRWMCEV